MSSLDWDKMEFSYQATDSDNEIRLPLKLLILGDFSGQYRLDIGSPVVVDKHSFPQVMKSIGAGISIEIAMDLTNQGVQFLDIDFKANSISDFEPETLINKIDYLAAHVELIELLKGISSDIELSSLDLTQEHNQILQICGIEPGKLNIEELSFIVFDVNEHLHEVLSFILHHEQFQQQEAIWRNLYSLLSNLSDNSHCIIEILDVNKALLEEDFYANRDIQETSLYDLVYLKEYGQYGGQPYSVIIGDYYFGSGAQDVQLLKDIGKVCSLAHAPFIGGVSPRLFNIDDFGKLESISDLNELLNSPKYIKWKGLQKQFESSYLGLALPRVKLRPRYNLPAGLLSELPFIENSTSQEQGFLYGNASFAYASCLISSFEKYSVCTDLVGTGGGRVDIYNSNASDGRVYPNFQIEAALSEKQLFELSGLGFLTLGFNKSQQQMFFTSSGSLRWGRFTEPSQCASRSPITVYFYSFSYRSLFKSGATRFNRFAKKFVANSVRA